MNPIAMLLVQLENDRCQALLSGDQERLEELLHPDLIHVHAKGNVESFDSYVTSGAFKSNYTTLQRFGDLKVHVLGSAALMTGRQLAESVRKATGEHVLIDSMVTQVWALNGDRWQQISYQTTPIEMTVKPAAAHHE